MTRIRIFFTVCLALFLLPFLPTRSFSTGAPPVLANNALGIVLSRGLVTYPLRKGVYQTKIAPAWVSLRDSRNGQQVDMKGFGFGAALTYGLSDHWGLNFIVGHVKTTGSRNLATDYSQGDGASGNIFATPKSNGNDNGLPGEARGTALLVNLIWDHWSGDGFRLPVYLGTGYMVAEGSVVKATGLKRDARTASPVITVGLSPSFRIKKWFRLGGFFLMSGPLSGGKGHIVDFDPATGAEISSVTFDISDDPLESGAAIMGLEATYLPWGLGLTYVPPIEGGTSISLKWSREWGGDQD